MNIILAIVLAMAVNGSMVDPKDFSNWEVECAEQDMVGNTPVVKLCLQNHDPNHPIQRVLAITIKIPDGIGILAYGYECDGVLYWFQFKNGKYEQITPIRL